MVLVFLCESRIWLVKRIVLFSKYTCHELITGRNEVVAKVIFLHLSVSHSVHEGACVAKGGHAWRGGGVCGEGGHAWQRRACVAKGGWGACVAKWGAWQGGHAWQRGHVCHTQPTPLPTTTRYSRSMRGRYASYWNAYLFRMRWHSHHRTKTVQGTKF